MAVDTLAINQRELTANERRRDLVLDNLVSYGVTNLVAIITHNPCSRGDVHKLNTLVCIEGQGSTTRRSVGVAVCADLATKLVDEDDRALRLADSSLELATASRHKLR